MMCAVPAWDTSGPVHRDAIPPVKAGIQLPHISCFLIADCALDSRHGAGPDVKAVCMTSAVRHVQLQARSCAHAPVASSHLVTNYPSTIMANGLASISTSCQQAKNTAYTL